ncbi:hypothetical protein ACFXPZ_17950 [Streptomyces sp. NPDC059101]
MSRNRPLNRRERLTLIGIIVSGLITGIVEQATGHLLKLLPWQ